jgi:hypothetical protein
MADYEVERMTGRCNASGRELAEGEEFYTVLFDRNGTLERADYATDAWQGPPDDAFCFWKSRVPTREKKKKIWVDNEVLFNLFERLADEEALDKIQFRFVLALLLMRKKLLKYVNTVVEDGREFWIVRPPKSEDRYRVENPRLTDEQTEAVSAQLTAILHGDMAEALESAVADTDDAAAERPSATDVPASASLDEGAGASDAATQDEAPDANPSS